MSLHRHQVLCCCFFPPLGLLNLLSKDACHCDGHYGDILPSLLIPKCIPLFVVLIGNYLVCAQVPKPINFFLDAHSDEKGVKQILRLLLSKFIRSQPGRTDHDWANMWRDLLSLQEKAFPFLDLEYVLIEYCRGLLKAGKFSLARNYLRGTGSISLATDKAENLVIQAAREYFFSAPTLACSEVFSKL